MKNNNNIINSKLYSSRRKLPTKPNFKDFVVDKERQVAVLAWVNKMEQFRRIHWANSQKILRLQDTQRRLLSTFINRSVVNVIKDKKHTTWTIGFSMLDKPFQAMTSLPKEVHIGRDYIFIVKVVLLNYDLEKSGGRLGHTHLMCGTQAMLNYDGDKSFQEFLKEVQAKVSITIEDYGMEDVELECIQVLFWNIGLSIKKENLHDTTNRSLSLNQEYKGDFTLPINTNPQVLGKPLNASYDKNGYVTSIETGLNNNFIENVLSKIQLSKQINSVRWDKFDHTWNFHEVTHNSRTYILGIHSYNTSTLEKVLFTTTGSILYSATDYYDKDGEFTNRISGNKSIIGDKYNIHEISRELKLSAISNVRNKFNIHQYMPNTNIGSLDCETFIDKDGIDKVFALGFKDNINKKPHLYYINDYEGESSKMIIEFINDIMAPKYNNITFYCHKWGNYESIFIIKVLNEFNNSVFEKYKMSYHFRDNKIYKLVIHDTSDRNRKVTICDSYTILNSNIKDLCESFEIDDNKLYFPHIFVSRETLNYKGVTPNREYYIDIPINEYNKQLSDNWHLREECLKYLDKDLEVLIKILNKVNDQLFNDYNVSITDKSTIAGLASKIFMKDHYKSDIPYINKSTAYNDIVKGYYGGITEVYRPYGENLYYYDVNSLYPSVCLNALPGVNNCKSIEYIDKQPNIKDIFGFYYCDVETPKDLYFGVLPVRNEKGLVFPLGKFSGWYFSEELKFASSLGYKINIHKGYSFEKHFDIFKSYVDKIYSIKNNPVNKTQKSIAKGLLNNLLGRFGISLYKPITKIVDINMFDDIMRKYRIVDHKNLSMNNILVTYYDILDPVLIQKSGLTLEEVWENKNHENTQHTLTSIVTSAAITAYARIAISKIKLDILENGGNIYYSDTDSIVTDKELPINMVNASELGKLKLEHVIQKAIFISGKTYCLINDQGKFINKAKGLKSSSLKWEDYMKMLKDLPISGKKETYRRDWEIGAVKISTENVELHVDVYKKREKLYENNLWVNTKPLLVGVDTDISTNKTNSTSNSGRNFFNVIPLTGKRFYSIKHIFDNKINKQSKNPIRNYLEKLNNKIKSILGYTKYLIIEILLVLLIITLYIIYWAFKLDEDIMYENTETSVELENLNESDIVYIKDVKKSVQNVCKSKGHGLLDDSMYNNNEYSDNYLSSTNEKKTFIKKENTTNTCINNLINESNQDNDNLIHEKNSVLVNYNEKLIYADDDLFKNKINKLESANSFKSVIIDPYNSSEYDPNKTYISYELSDNSHVVNKMLVELADDQPAVPIDASFTLTYKPKSIIRDSFYKEGINIHDDVSDNKSVKSDSSESHYFSLDSMSDDDKSDDESTIISIINQYTK